MFSFLYCFKHSTRVVTERTARTAIAIRYIICLRWCYLKLIIKSRHFGSSLKYESLQEASFWMPANIPVIFYYWHQRLQANQTLFNSSRAHTFQLSFFIIIFIHLLYIHISHLNPLSDAKKETIDSIRIGCSNSHSQFIMSSATILFFTFCCFQQLKVN